MNVKSFLIIGGTFKSGTSSLFTYLNQISNICGSKKKETGFFVPARYGKKLPPIEEYFNFFPDEKEGKILMEASPGYLYGNTKIANTIKTELEGEIKLIFILRNPTDRYISFYNMLTSGFIEDIQSEDLIDSNTTLMDYFHKCREYREYNREERIDYVLHGLKDGCYVEFLNEWYKIYNDSNIKLIFFDDLENDSKQVCSEILEWLSLDGSEVNGINFRIVNKARKHKNQFLRKMAATYNGKYEHFFRNHPRIKEYLVRIYAKVNFEKNETLIEGNSIKQIDQYYKPFNDRLRDFMVEKGYETKQFPLWLTRN